MLYLIIYYFFYLYNLKFNSNDNDSNYLAVKIIISNIKKLNFIFINC